MLAIVVVAVTQLVVTDSGFARVPPTSPTAEPELPSTLVRPDNTCSGRMFSSEAWSTTPSMGPNAAAECLPWARVQRLIAPAEQWQVGVPVHEFLPIAEVPLSDTHYSLSPTALPPGLSLSDFVISGTPTRPVATTDYTWRASHRRHRRLQAGFTFSAEVITGEPAHPPTGLTAAHSSGSVTLAWTAPSGVRSAPTAYAVQRQAAGESDFSPLVSLSEAVSGYVDTTVTLGVEYTYRVVAVYGGQRSVPSGSATVDVPAAPVVEHGPGEDAPTLAAPHTPRSLTARADLGVGIVLEWSGPQGGGAVRGYHVEQKTGDGEYFRVRRGLEHRSAQEPIRWVSSTVRGRESYTYRVISYNAAGESSPSNEVTVRTPEHLFGAVFDHSEIDSHYRFIQGHLGLHSIPTASPRRLVSEHTVINAPSWLNDRSWLQTLSNDSTFYLGGYGYQGEIAAGKTHWETIRVRATIRTQGRTVYGYSPPITLVTEPDVQAELPELADSIELPLNVPSTYALPPITQGNAPLGITVHVPTSSGLVYNRAQNRIEGTLRRNGTRIFFTVWDVDGDRDTHTMVVSGVSESEFRIPTELAPLADQDWRVGRAVELQLPATYGSRGHWQYSLTPELPTGVTRAGFHISGTPTATQSSTTYTWRADNTLGQTVSVRFALAVTEVALPSVPRLYVFSTGLEGVDLRWDPDPMPEHEEITNYIVTRREVGVDASFRELAILDGDARSYTDWSATFGTEFGYILTARNSAGQRASVARYMTPTRDAAPHFDASTVRPEEVQLVDGYAFQLDFSQPQPRSGVAPTLSYTLVGDLPTGVSLDSTSGMMRGTPRAVGIQRGQVEAYSVRIEVRTEPDREVVENRLVRFTLEPDYPAPVVTDPGLQLALREKVHTAELWGAEYENQPVVYSESGLRAIGLRLDGEYNSGRRIVGTPTTLGTHPVTVTATDFNGDTSTLTFNIEVVGARSPEPFTATVPEQEWSTSTAVNLTLPSTTGGDGELTYTLEPSELPAGVQRNGFNLSGTPTVRIPPTTYAWRATDADGDSVTTEFLVGFGDESPPVHPRLISAMGSSGDTPAIELTWRQPDQGGAVTEYLVYRKTADSTYAQVGLARPARNATGHQEYSFSDTASVARGVQYAYVVAAINAFSTPVVGVGSNELTAVWFGPGPLFDAADFKSTYRLIQGRSDIHRMPTATRGTGELTYSVIGDAAPWISIVQSRDGELVHLFSAPAADDVDIPSGQTRTATFQFRAVDSQGRTELGPEVTATLERNYTPDYEDANPYSTTVIVGDEVAIDLADFPSPANLPFQVTVNGLHSDESGLTYNAGLNRIEGTAALPTDPAAQARGTLFVRVHLEDADGQRTLDLFLITVEHPATPAPFARLLNHDWRVGEPVPSSAIMLQTTGGNGDLTYTLTPELPDGVSLHESDIAIRLTGTPTTAAETPQIYTWTATDFDGDQVSSTFSITVHPASIGRATNVRAISMLGGTLVEWAPVPQSEGPVTGYRVERKRAGSQSFTNLAVVDADEHYHVDRSFYRNSSFVYRVVALNGDEVGPPSAEVSADGVFTVDTRTYAGPYFFYTDSIGNERHVIAGRDTWGASGVVLPAALAGSAPYTYSLVGELPSGLRFDPTGPALRGYETMVMPSGVDVAEYEVYLTVQDSNGARAVSWPITITVERNFQPVLQPIAASHDARVGEPITPIVFSYLNDRGTATPQNGDVEVLVSGLQGCAPLQSNSRTVNEYEITGTPTTTGVCNVTVRVRDWDREEDQASFVINVLPAAGAPEAPTDLTATEITPGTVELTWVAPPAPENPVLDYRVEHRTGDNPWTTLAEVDVEIASYRHTLLAAGSTQKYRLLARNSVGAGAPTAEVTVQLNLQTPGEPTNLQVSRSTQRLDVEWGEPVVDGGSLITGYRVQYSVDQDSGHEFMDWPLAEGAVMNTAITGLQPRTAYAVRVAAVNQLGVGRWTPVVIGNTGNSSPTFVVPADADADTFANRSVNENTPAGTAFGVPFTATDPDGDTVRLELAHSRFGHYFDLHADGRLALSATRPLNFEDLQGVRSCRCSRRGERDTEAVFVVPIQAKDDFGGTTQLNVSVTIHDVAEPPLAPTNLAISTYLREADFAWQAADNAGRPPIQGYHLEYRALTTPTPAWQRVQVGPSSAASLTSAPLGSFEARVRAFNHEGESDWSAVSLVIRSDAPVFAESTVTQLQVAENSPPGTLIGDPFQAADPSGDPVQYQLARHDSNQFAIAATTGQLTVGTAGTLDVEEFGGRPAVAWLVVRAVDATGEETDLSVSVTVTDDTQEQPLAPTQLRVVSDQSTHVIVEWTAPDNAGRPPITAYEVEYLSGTDDWQVASTDANAAATTLTVRGLDEHSSYSFRVRASNRDGDGVWSETLVVDRNQPPVFADAPQVTRRVTEGVWGASVRNPAGGGQLLGAPITATDPNGDTVTYRLVSNERTTFRITPPRQYAVIDRDTGQVRVGPQNWFDWGYDDIGAPPGTVDRELIIVRATDSHGAYSEIDLVIEVENAPEPPPAVQTPTVASFTETSVVLTWPKIWNNTRPDAENFDLQHRAEGATAWSESQRIGDNVLLTYETGAVYGLQAGVTYEYRVRARNSEGDGPWSTVVSDGGRGTTSTTPFTAPPITFWLGERSPAGTVVGDLGKAFTDLRTIDSYTLTSSAAGTIPFEVDVDGQLTVAATAELNWRQSRLHRFHVNALAGTEIVRTRDVIVFLFLVPETAVPVTPSAPSVSAVRASAPDRFAVSSVLLVDWSRVWTSRVSANVQLRYRTVGASAWTTSDRYPHAQWQQPITGLAGTTAYEVQVRLTGRSDSGTWSETATATTLQKLPTFHGDSRVTYTVIENTAVPYDRFGGTWGAPDDLRTRQSQHVGTELSLRPLDNGATVNWDELMWSLAGSDASAFGIYRAGPNRDIAQVHWAESVKPDYEAKSVYQLNAVVTDTYGGRAELPITVELTDADEPPFTPWNAQAADITDSTLTLSWEIVPGDRPAVTKIDVQYWPRAATGALTDVAEGGAVSMWRDLPGYTRRLPISNLIPAQAYVFQLRARNDEGISDWSTGLEVSTLAPAAPVFVEAEGGTRTVSEDAGPGESVGEPFLVTHTGAQAPTLELDGELLQIFEVRANGQIVTTGELELGADIDYETKSSYTGFVVASNSGGTASIPVTIEILDVSEPPYAPSDVRVTERGFDHLQVEWTAPYASGRPPVTTYEFRRTAGSVSAVISTSELEGATATFRGLTNDTTYSFAVRGINDEGAGAWSSPAYGRTLSNIPAPVFAEGSSARRTVAEDASGDSIVGDPVAATQAGGYTVTYYLLGALNEAFSIDEGTGQIRLRPNAVLDHENQASYAGAVYAVNEDTSASIAVQVYVTDVAEVPLAPTALQEVATSSTTLTIGWTDPELQGRPAVTGYEFAQRASVGATPTAMVPVRLLGTEATFSGLTAAQDYSARVRAVNDEGVGAWSEWLSGTLPAATVDAPTPPAGEPLGPVVTINIPEGIGPGAAVGDRFVVPLNGRSRLNWRVDYPGPNIGRPSPPFAIPAQDGQVRTIAGATYDHESRPVYRVIVSAAGVQSDFTEASIDSFEVIINITDVAESPAAPTGLTVTERQTNSLTVRWQAPDTSDRPAITRYEFQQRDTDTVRVTPVTPTQLGSNWARFDGLTPDHQYQYVVRAVNDEGTGDWSSWVTGSTLVEQVPAPVFAEGAETTRELPENAPAHTFVGDPVTATQAGGGTLQYSLLGVLDRKFTIDAATGRLSTIAGVRYDYEATPSYEGVVLADNGSSTTSIKVVVNVVDDAEPPGRPFNVVVAATTENSVTLNWAMPDMTGHPPIQRYEFSRHRWPTNALESTQPSAWLNDMSVRFDGLDSGVRYSYRVRAINAEGTGRWSPDVSGRTLGPSAPGSTAPGSASGSEVRSIPENTLGGVDVGLPVQVVATNADGPIRYRLFGTVEDSFEIDAVSGQIRTKPSSTYDHEAASFYRGGISVTGTPGLLLLDLTILISDVAEPPLAPTALAATDEQATSFTLHWDAPDASDRPRHTSYEFMMNSGPGAGSVSVVPNQLEANKAYFRGLTPQTTYGFRMRAISDEGDGAWSAWLAVRTTELSVEFVAATATRSISENTVAGTAVGAPVAAATNGNQHLTYYLVGPAGQAFSIDPRTGQVRTKSGVDYDFESTPSYTGEVYVSNGTHGDHLQLTVQVTDVDEPPAVPVRPTITEVLRTSLSMHWTVPVPGGRPVTSGYEFDMRTGGAIVRANPTYSDEHSAQFGGLSPNTAYDFRVRAVNAEGRSPWSDWVSTRTLLYMPVFGDGRAAERSVPENSPRDVGVGAPVLATYAAIGELRYSLEGSVSDAFWIDAGSGQLRTRNAVQLDHETTPVYHGHVVARVRDQAAVPQHIGTQRIPLTVLVTDQDEPPGTPTNVSLLASETGMRLHWQPADNTGKPTVSSFEVEQRQGAGGAFAAATPAASGDGFARFEGLAEATEYTYRVRAVNAEGTSDWSPEVTATTAETPPVFSESPQVLRSIAEGVERTREGPIKLGAPVVAISASGRTIGYELFGEVARHFTIGRHTGQIYSRVRGVRYDHEGAPFYTGRVQAFDGVTTSSVDLRIDITDVDEPPIAPWGYSVHSRYADKATVTWRRSSYPDIPPTERWEFSVRIGGTSEFQLIQPTRINGTTAVFSGLHGGLTYSFRIRGVNAEGAGAWTRSFDTRVIDDRPQFAEGGNAVRSIPENIGGGQPVGEPVVAHDTNAQQLVYSLYGNLSRWFSIDRRTGQVRTRNDVSFDFERQRTYSGNLYALDGRIISAIRLEVRIEDQPEPPDAPHGLTIVDRQASQLTVRWEVEESSGRPPTTGFDFRQRAGASSGFSSVLPAVIGDNTATLSGLHPDTDYELQVRATNDEGASGWSTSGTGRTAVSDRPTVIVVDPDLVDVVRSVPENASGGAELGVALSDLLANPARFILLNGNAHGFAIDRSTGQLTVGSDAAFDFETDQRYLLTVMATETNHDQTQFAVTVNITDVDEPPLAPSAPTLAGAGTNGLTVEWIAPDMTGRPDLTGYEVQYRSVGTSTYTMLDAAAINGEQATLADLSPNTVHLFQVRAMNAEGTGPWSADGLGSTLAVAPGVVISSSDGEPTTVASVDVPTATQSVQQNHGPVFSETSVNVDITRSAVAGTAVGDPVQATDPDAEDTLTYSLAGDDSVPFTIDALTGQITVGTSGLNAGATHSGYTLIVGVTDGRDIHGEPDLSTDATMRVHVGFGDGVGTATSVPVSAAALSSGHSSPQNTGTREAHTQVSTSPQVMQQLRSVQGLNEQVIGSVGAHIVQRFTASGGNTHVAIGGRTVTLQPTTDAVDELSLAALASPFDNSSDGESWGGNNGDLLRGLQFESPLFGDQTTQGHGVRWALWGAGEELTPDANGMDSPQFDFGDVNVSHLGVEARHGHKGLTGVSFSQGTGKVSDSNDGEGAWTTVSVSPYARWTPADGIALWGIGGAQDGEVQWAEGGSVSVRSLWLATGADYQLHSRDGASLGLTGRAEAVRMHATTTASDRDSSLTVASDRFEFDLYGVRAFGGSTAPIDVQARLGVRRERAEEWSGMATRIASELRHSGLPNGWEVVANAEYADRLDGDNRFGRSFEMSLRRQAPSTAGGLNVELTRRWSSLRNVDSSAEWWDELDTGFDGTGSSATTGWRASFGYDIPVTGGQQIVMPYVNLVSESVSSRNLRTGVRVKAIPEQGVWSVDLFGEQRSTGDDDDNRIGLDASIRF